jgi:hypothetical protein
MILKAEGKAQYVKFQLYDSSKLNLNIDNYKLKRQLFLVVFFIYKLIRQFLLK